MSSQQLNVQDDWPSATFREELVERLEPELVRIKENSPHMFVSSARHIEEIAFAESLSKAQYMQRIFDHVNPFLYSNNSLERPSTPPGKTSIRLMDLEPSLWTQTREIDKCRQKSVEAQIELEVQITRTKNEIRTLKSVLENVKAQNQGSADPEEERVSDCLQKSRDSLNKLRLSVKSFKTNYVDLDTRKKEITKLAVDLEKQRYREERTDSDGEWDEEEEYDEDDCEPSSAIEWPSYSYRCYVAQRLKTEIKNNRKTSKNLPIPGMAKQIEEYAFSMFGSSKSKYMRTIVTMIDALQDYYPGRSIPYKSLINERTEGYLRAEVQKVSDSLLKLQESENKLNAAVTKATELIKQLEVCMEGIQTKHSKFIPCPYRLTADECNISNALKQAYNHRKQMGWSLEALATNKIELEDEKATLLEYLERVVIQAAQKRADNRNDEVEDDEEDEEDNKREREEYEMDEYY